MDSLGHVAAAASSGGSQFKTPGRIGQVNHFAATFNVYIYIILDIFFIYLYLSVCKIL